MATGQTKLANLINPQVMADMIAAELPKKIKMSPFATIDNTLVGVAGNTITIPKFAYIGEADDVAEGIAAGTTVLTATTSQATVKKAVKAVELTDEAMLSGYGDPVGEATRQLTLSLADKIDSDCMTAAVGASKVADKSSAVISYNSIVDAVDLFEDEDDEAKALFIHPKQLTTLRKDANFIDKNKFGADVMMTGSIGQIAGCQVVVSKKVKDLGSGVYANVIMKAGALALYMKRGVNAETDRDVLKSTTILKADEHYVAAVKDERKVVVLKAK